ncbi:putative transcription elongation factor SPT4-like protein [Monocercomonoides exilis]|uniref:putative transcription elongation factor SPT4-like protein n=1 Tax=Monocercomonoides exilis TaxID=2049356 RepID=UPI00355AA8EB|nr:putative transcription elongation factor SPT4-like protein [Monocercomonoides exilis]|eukprot:MONOS_8633.1-p1 / transcript=MONOS_8633.1 / gene=MONOS_8633 / organism=Monocercomonoides_exilis_PA203 / gene_product=transcription elongation factor SPT4-like protein / transcript_product=transcription elongation factor SPT4-like protein / location=Mono_scaffold00330:34210-34694(+) / protein_length=117 / sequence_SO=supercontig / SO=protein_coding / is_pseudo=false
MSEKDGVIPLGMKRSAMRACLVCGLIKTAAQFQAQGCENCERYLQMKGDKERVEQTTTQNFQSLVGITDPMGSWIASRLRLTEKVPGCYAVSIKGRLPEDLYHELADSNVVIRSETI